MQVVLSVVRGPHEGTEFAFATHENFVVGRGSLAHYRLPDDPYFSRLHFMVEVNPPSCRVLDLASRNGTLVNKQRVAFADLGDGDVIQAGHTLLRVRIDRDPTGTGAIDDSSAVVPASADREPANTSTAAGSVECQLEELLPIDDGESSADRSDCLPDDYEQRIRSREQPIDGYLLVDEIGRGGMGAVYLAIREEDRAVAAVKTVLPAIAMSDRELARFLREARILEQLQHPNIVSFREMGESNGLLWFAMDYVQGTDASELLAAHGGPLPVRRAARLICQMLDAVEFAHAKGFVHRDIKPSNLLVNQECSEEQGKLADFGLARIYQASSLSGLTLTGDMGGTPQFMPPEQITDYRNCQPTVDQYAAAATLYFLLTGEFIYDFPPDLGRQLLMILQQSPVPIQQRRPEVPDQLAFVIHRALAREPGHRFEGVGELRAAISRFM